MEQDGGMCSWGLNSTAGFKYVERSRIGLRSKIFIRAAGHPPQHKQRLKSCEQRNKMKEKNQIKFRSKGAHTPPGKQFFLGFFLQLNKVYSVYAMSSYFLDFTDSPYFDIWLRRQVHH